MFLSFPLNSYWFLIDRRLRPIFSGGNITVFCLLTLELVPLFRGMQEQSIYSLPAVHFLFEDKACPLECILHFLWYLER